MSPEHDDHVPSMTASVAGDSAGDRSLLTSPEDSVLEKTSPAPASVHSDTVNLAQNEGEKEKEKTDDKKLRTMDSNDPDAEPVYPSMITKVLVGVGLALAVFLVTPSLLLRAKWLMW